jgi:hypothetical protein
MRRRAGIPPVLALLAVFCGARLSIGAATGQQPPPTTVNDDLPALLAQMKTNMKANSRLASRYTFDGTTDCKIYDPKGKLLSDVSNKWITVTIDGIEYNRIVEENGKPLSRRKQIAEQKRSDAVGKMGNGYDFVFDVVGRDPHDNIYSDLPISYLDTLFENQVLGPQLIAGRDNLVIDSTPKLNAKPQSDREKTALDWREITWIDIEDSMPSRYDVQLVSRKRYMLVGSFTGVEFTRLPVSPPPDSQPAPHVWLMHGSTAHFIFWPTNSEVLRDDFYNYKRFQSDAHVLEHSVQEVPDPAAGK